MTAIHRQEKAQFRKLFQQEEGERLDDRFIVLEAFLNSEEHVTASELKESLDRSGKPMELDFVRDTLKLLSHYGFAQSNRFDNGQVRYEHLHLGQHHDHMICTRCRSIIEFQSEALETLQERLASERGFLLLQHRMEIYGICADCQAQRRDRQPLTTSRAGERLVIRELIGGTGTRLRLTSMGLRIGDTVEVITNIDRGQVVLASEHKRFVLGRGLAQKIMVQPAGSETR
jgi:Fur family ferric uptake transcriptional regulator